MNQNVGKKYSIENELMITASIILYNTDLNLLKTIVECASRSCINRIYVIDNSPTNRLQEESMKLSKKVEYFYGQGNVGYGAGHNIGIKKAIEVGAKYHVVLNPDIFFPDNTIENLTDYANSHERIGMLMPNVKYPNGEQQYLCKLLPSPMDILGRRVLPKNMIAKRNERYEMRSTGYKNIRNVPCLSGCFMFLNVDVLKKVGLFDDRFFMYFEDFDLIRRIHKVAMTVFYPKLTIIHNNAKEHRTNKKLLKISISSAIKYFNKWGWCFDSDRRKWNKEAFDETQVLDDNV